jgi:hypothetical protein
MRKSRDLGSEDLETIFAANGVMDKRGDPLSWIIPKAFAESIVRTPRNDR